MNFAQVWDLGFASFEVFVGVGLIWLGFLEPLFPSRTLSVQLMTLVAVLAAAGWFYRGWRNARRERLAAQALWDAAAAMYEDEVG